MSGSLILILLCANQSPWYFASGNPDDKTFDLFTDRSTTRHAANRRKVAALYSNTNLIKMESCVHECTELLVDNFKKIAQTGQAVNLQFWMQCYAFDLIGLITVSRRFGLLDKGEDKTGMLKSLHKYLRYCASVGVYYELHSWIFKPLMVFGAGGFGHMINFTAQQISQQKDSPRKDDFLGKVMALNKENPERFTDIDIFTTCITNIGAGSDTTSISLTSILYHLMKEPRCFRKVHSMSVFYTELN
jgi:cytochrome P450